MAKRTVFPALEKDISELSVEKWILILLHDKGEMRTKDAVSLVSELFITVCEIMPSRRSLFEFRSSDAGPQSEKVEHAVNSLLSKNMLEFKKNPKGYGGRGYTLTQTGNREAEKILGTLPRVFTEKFRSFTGIISLMGSLGTIQYLHSMYPEFVFVRDGGEHIV